MTDTLLFPLQDVLAHANHAWKSPEHKPTFMEHTENIEPEATLWFVKDAGAYVMSNGTNPDRPDVVYARVEGTELTLSGDVAYDKDPELWDLIWNTTRDICGGDDFAEGLPSDFVSPEKIGHLMAKGYTYLAITLDEDQMGLEFRK